MRQTRFSRIEVRGQIVSNPKVFSHTKYGIPTSNMLRTQFSRTNARGQGHSDPKTVHNTLQPQGVSTHEIWDSYLKQYRRCAPDTIFLEPRPGVKVTVTRKQYVTLWDPKVYQHTKYGIPMRSFLGRTVQKRWGHKNSFCKIVPF